MKVHTTNYQNTFIQVAADCSATSGQIPMAKGDAKTIAQLQYNLISNKPYQYTSDDVLFHVFAMRNNLTEHEMEKAREQFFSKGQPCFRASPLTKRYGWGIHYNGEAKVALYGCHTPAYKQLSEDKNLKVIKAMRSGK